MKSVGVRSGESEQVASAGEYAVGQRVSHARFGGGRIEALERLSTDTKITVLFDNPLVGKKALLAKYAKLKVES
jgi:DNA helicase-2/ATP-dependent DNA helicase PcrA